MKTGNRAARSIIVASGYSFFCKFRKYRHAGYGMQQAIARARGVAAAHNLADPDDDDAALGFDVVGAAA